MMKLLVVLCLTSVSLAYEDKSLYQYFTDNSNLYSRFLQAIDRVSLQKLFQDGGPYTVFAPTDAAFLSAGLVSLDFFTPEQLMVTVEYTMVPEFILSSMISGVTNRNTVANQSIAIEQLSGSLRLNNVSMVAANHDIIVNNGVVQPVGTILTPPVWPTRPPPTTPPKYTVYQLIIRDDTRFKDLTLAFLLADLIQTIEVGQYTLFAPTDTAFGVYTDNLLDVTSPGAQAIYQEVLKYHLVPGRHTAASLTNGQKLLTLHGTTITVSIGSGVMVNNATVIEADMLATNGVVHAIDHVLLPQDINQVAQG
ncbi:hypothetical protein ACF0H5_010922 [Mactra antiquata]